jgi:hypothetical protein
MDRPPAGVHVDALHPRQVDHEPAVGDRPARDVVPAAPHRDLVGAIVVVVGSMYFIKDNRSQLVLSFVSLAVVAGAYLLRKRRGAPALTTSEPGLIGGAL